ncbi:hypothetical protein [Nocardia sp. NPDC051981]|uniref:hypothetical protein n=1 Tax=Nocardia sp. NPDC051981 TaxID=3155417 RepID=UPI00342454D5
MNELPDWAKQAAAVCFRVSGRAAVECRIDRATSHGITLSNGERFEIAHLRRGKTDDTSYFEKFDARARIKKTARRT